MVLVMVMVVMMMTYLACMSVAPSPIIMTLAKPWLSFSFWITYNDDDNDDHDDDDHDDHDHGDDGGNDATFGLPPSLLVSSFSSNPL
jgi:hypothetical protein